MSAAPDAPYVVGTRRAFWLGRGAVAAVFAVVCALNLRHASALVAAIALVGLVLFGVLGLYALRQLLRRGPRLVLDRRGVEAADLGIGVVPWERIAAIEPFGSNDAPFLAFHVREPEALLTQLPGVPRAITRWLRASGYPLFSVNLMGVDRPLDEVAHRARAFWRAAVATRAD